MTHRWHLLSRDLLQCNNDEDDIMNHDDDDDKTLSRHNSDLSVTDMAIEDLIGTADDNLDEMLQSSNEVQGTLSVAVIPAFLKFSCAAITSHQKVFLHFFLFFCTQCTILL